MPVRNEEEHIRASLQSLLDQSYPLSEYEIIIIDGRSSDRTKQIIEEIRNRHPQVRCLDNPPGIVPTGMNIGIRAARGKIIVRVDGHSIYPRDYAANCIKSLEETKADNVGGPCMTVAADESLSARLVAAVLSNPFGVGNSKFRTSREEGYVDTVPFGAFRREVFARVGMYNEKLVRNQDIELNARIRQSGGKIYLTPVLTTQYYPVKSFLNLLKRTFKTSQWHIFTLRENRDSLGRRHLVPILFLVLLMLLLPASLVSNTALAFLIGTLCAYFLTGFYFSLPSRSKDDWGVALVQPFATFCFHMAYGVGTLFGLRYVFKQPSVMRVRAGSFKPVHELSSCFKARELKSASQNAWPMTCPLCSERDAQYRFSERGYNLMQCSRCHLFYIDPYPRAVENHHKIVESYAYDDLKILDAKNYYAAEVGFYRDYFGPISEQVNGASSFLDVGCGTGRLLELFVGRNLYRAGIELNHSRAAFARSVAKCEIFEQPIEEFSGQRFDAIGLINVLSHIPSLAGLFVKLKSLLSDHGKLIIKTGELQSHVKKAALHDWGIPDHLQFLGADTAAFIAQNYGLHLQICKRIPLSEEIFSLNTWTAKGRNPLRNAVKSAAVHLPGALRVMRSCYEFIHHESVMSSFLVFTNY